MCDNHESEDKQDKSEIEECLGLRYNIETKKIDLAVNAQGKYLIVNLEIEEAKEFLKGLSDVIADAESIEKEKLESEKTNTDPENSEE